MDPRACLGILISFATSMGSEKVSSMLRDIPYLGIPIASPKPRHSFPFLPTGTHLVYPAFRLIHTEFRLVAYCLYSSPPLLLTSLLLTTLSLQLPFFRQFPLSTKHRSENESSIRIIISIYRIGLYGCFRCWFVAAAA